jgi:hypothetical protein
MCKNRSKFRDVIPLWIECPHAKNGPHIESQIGEIE